MIFQATPYATWSSASPTCQATSTFTYRWWLFSGRSFEIGSQIRWLRYVSRSVIRVVIWSVTRFVILVIQFGIRLVIRLIQLPLLSIRNANCLFELIFAWSIDYNRWLSECEIAISSNRFLSDTVSLIPIKLSVPPSQSQLVIHKSTTLLDNMV